MEELRGSREASHKTANRPSPQRLLCMCVQMNQSKLAINKCACRCMAGRWRGCSRRADRKGGWHLGHVGDSGDGGLLLHELGDIVSEFVQRHRASLVNVGYCAESEEEGSALRPRTRGAQEPAWSCQSRVWQEG